MDDLKEGLMKSMEEPAKAPTNYDSQFLTHVDDIIKDRPMREDVIRKLIEDYDVPPARAIALLASWIRKHQEVI